MPSSNSALLRRPPRSVCVVGGGTAGYFAALALKRTFPDLSVTQIESSAIPIIGVGEATTTLMPAFLHRTLGLDIVEMFRAVGPTFKLGIRFEWGSDAIGFSYPFGDNLPIDAVRYDGNLRTQSVLSHFMAEDRGPLVRAPDGSTLSLLPSLKFAYHLENRAFVAFLAAAAKREAIEHIDATIADVTLGDDGIAALNLADGRALSFDLYIDATGFRSLLLGASEVPFQSYASSLFCDRAVVGPVPQMGVVQPYTFAETMDAGWCWRTPVDGEDHRGYVYSSAFLSDDEALREMRAKNPTMTKATVVKFSSGRRRDFWHGNVIAIGNSYGFVEPLESTALHMIVIQLACVLEILGGTGKTKEAGAPIVARQVERANRAVGDHWDYLRWFLAVHYRFNARLDTPFWRAARAEVDVSGIEEKLARYRHEGPWMPSAIEARKAIDHTFNDANLMVLLLGQNAPGSAHVARRPPPEAWRTRTAREASVAARALSHRESLDTIRAHPEMLRAFVDAPRSWIHKESAALAAFVQTFVAP